MLARGSCDIRFKVPPVLKIATSDYSPLILTPEVTQPAVYLDYCVIGDLARDPATGQEFRNCLLEKGGTLYLSWAHLVELFGLGSGPTYNSIRSYLASFDRSFVLIDNNARAVIGREADWAPGKQNPVFDEDLLRCLAANWDGRGEFNMALLLDVVSSAPSIVAQLQDRHRKHKHNLKTAFDDARARYRADREWRRQLDNATYAYAPGAAPTEYIYLQISRECIVTHEQFNPSDGLDFEHCVVSLAYCDYVVLDKKWTRRCGKIIIPPTAAAVFSGVQVDRLVRQIESWSKSPAKT